jgi:hypothetical protein
LPRPDNGRYIVRDTELKGFFLMVGARKRIFMVQADLRTEGKRGSTIRVAIGDTTEFSTRAARAVAKEYLIQIGRGIHPKNNSKATKASTVANTAANEPEAPRSITLKEAWARYHSGI